MDTRYVQIEGGRRCSSSHLEKILAKVPISISGPGLELKAYVGLGKIVYVEPINSLVYRIKVTGKDIKIETNRNLNNNLIFNYKGRIFSIYYK